MWRDALLFPLSQRPEAKCPLGARWGVRTGGGSGRGWGKLGSTVQSNGRGSSDLGDCCLRGEFRHSVTRSSDFSREDKRQDFPAKPPKFQMSATTIHSVGNQNMAIGWKWPISHQYQAVVETATEPHFTSVPVRIQRPLESFHPKIRIDSHACARANTKRTSRESLHDDEKITQW